MSGKKKKKKQGHSLHGQTWRWTSPVMRVLCDYGKLKYLLYERHNGFCEESGHFGRECDAFCAEPILDFWVPYAKLCRPGVGGSSGYE